MASMFHVVTLILGGAVVDGVVGGVEDVQVPLAKWYQRCGVGISNFLRVLPSCAASLSANTSFLAKVSLLVIVVAVVAVLHFFC